MHFKIAKKEEDLLNDGNQMYEAWNVCNKMK